MTIATAKSFIDDLLVDSHVPDRAERPGGHQIVATSPEDVAGLLVKFDERIDDRRLADSRFAPDQGDLSHPSTRLGQESGEG